MEPADSIGRLGFARWYERRLIEAHAWFVSAFVCVVAIAACAEELAFRGSVGEAGVLRRRHSGRGGDRNLRNDALPQDPGRSRKLGEHATCGNCGAYARFKLTGSQARCRKCNHEWRLIDASIRALE